MKRAQATVMRYIYTMYSDPVAAVREVQAAADNVYARTSRPG